VLAIEAEGVAKRYGSRLGRAAHDALRGLDLRVEAGTAFGLIGPNGAGKTTFVKVLLGVAIADAGRIRLLGGDPADPAVRARVGYLPERLQLPASWSPREVLASVARLKGLRGAGAEAERLLERVGLAGERRRVGTFSKGMRQRLGLACALLGRPDLLVLDEPTDGLDPLGRVDVRALLAEEVARGATVFLNSHLLAETERVCTRIGVLARGRIVREGPLEALCAPGAAWAAWTARFAPGAEAALRAAGFAPAEAGAWSFEAGGPEALNRALDAARAGGAVLLELQRTSRDLEDVLAEAVGRAA
jgi:ABC-2 type transport system ATP-binding protein